MWRTSCWCLPRTEAFSECGNQQGERVQGLTQVVAGCGQKAGLDLDGGLSRLLLRGQFSRGLADAALQPLAPLLQGAGHAVDVLLQQAQFARRGRLHAYRQLSVGDALDRLAEGPQTRAETMAHAPGDRAHQGREQGHQNADAGQHVRARLLQARGAQHHHDPTGGLPLRHGGEIGIGVGAVGHPHGMAEHPVRAQLHLVRALLPGDGHQQQGVAGHHAP